MALAAKQTTAGSVAKRASHVNRPAVSRAALVVRSQQQNGPVEDMVSYGGDRHRNPMGVEVPCIHEMRLSAISHSSTACIVAVMAS